MMAGNTAPPMIAITSSDDPRLVSGPRFLMLSAKIVGNMIEWKNPISTTAHTGTMPFPTNATVTHTRQPTAKIESSRGAGMRFISAEPVKRPDMNPI